MNLYCLLFSCPAGIGIFKLNCPTNQQLRSCYIYPPPTQATLECCGAFAIYLFAFSNVVQDDGMSKYEKSQNSDKEVDRRFRVTYTFIPD